MGFPGGSSTFLALSSHDFHNMWFLLQNRFTTRSKEHPELSKTLLELKLVVILPEKSAKDNCRISKGQKKKKSLIAL